MAVKSLKRKTMGDMIFNTLNYTFMIVFSIIILFPFWDLLLYSFSDQKAASYLGFRVWIDRWYFDSYRYLFSTSRIYTAYYNTIFRTVVGTVASLFVVILAAYPLSKKNIPWRNVITIFFLIPMFFGGGLIPTYLLIRSLGMIDKIWVLIIPGLMNIFNMIILRNFLIAMDDALEESAFIDGANYFTILWKIVVPLSTPVLATIALWTAVGHWNSWFDALIYTRSESLMVLQLLIRRMITLTTADAQSLQSFNKLSEVHIHTGTVRAAAILVTIGPIVAAYPFLQKYFVKGIMIGSLKG